MRNRILILGGGFGGLTAAAELRRRLVKDCKITLIDKGDHYFMGLAKLWIMTGQRELGVGMRPLSLLSARGIEYVKDEVKGIDPANRVVKGAKSHYEYDYLLISLGAELAPSAVPGFQEGCHNLYNLDGVAELRIRLSAFRKGRIVVAVFGLPFKCPPAPYEAALLIEDMMVQKGVRRDVSINFFTPEPKPVPISSKCAEAIQSIFSERGIAYHPRQRPISVDGMRKLVAFEAGEQAGFDLLIGVPPHRAPEAIRALGLAADGWIPVDKKTLKTSYDDVFAVGDVTSIKIAGGFMLPKAGIFAEGEAKVVANNIAAAVEGMSGPKEYDGKGYCFMETARGEAAYIKGNLFAEPLPSLDFVGPLKEYLEEKKMFEQSRLREWFGQ